MIDDLLPEPLIRVGPDGTIEYLNRSARRLFDSPAARVGEPVHNLLNVDGERMENWLAERRRVAEMLPGRLQYVGRTGLISIAVEGGRVPGSEGSVLIRFRDEGAPYHRILALTKELEERRTALAKRDELLAALESEAEQLSLLARLDALTGLHNRREFDDVLKLEWSRAKRNARPLALIMLDMDHFKQINDRFGHGVGDDVLRMFGHLLEGLTRRATDFVARYGGEEFAVLLAETSLPETLRTVDAIVEAARELRIDGPDGSIDPTVSAGVSYRTPRNESPRELVDAADRALYRAKDAGRDRWLLDESVNRPETRMNLMS